MDRQREQRERAMNRNYTIHSDYEHIDNHLYTAPPPPSPETTQPSNPIPPRDHPNTPAGVDFATRVVVLASILTPIAFIPYLVVRKQLIALGTKASDAVYFNAALRREVKGALSTRHYEHEQLKALLKGMKDEQVAFTASVTKSLMGRVENSENMKSGMDDVRGNLMEMRLGLSERHNTWTELGKSIRQDVGQMRLGLDELRATVQDLVRKEEYRAHTVEAEIAGTEDLGMKQDGLEEVKVETVVQEVENGVSSEPQLVKPTPEEVASATIPQSVAGSTCKECPDCTRRQSQASLKKEDADEVQQSSSPTPLMRQLGTALADVAAFMEEVEVEQGLISRRGNWDINKIRQVAMQLQNFQDPKEGKIFEEKNQAK